ncbi:MAG: ArnT family glycosyltransferase [Bacteriovoracia bacterium]
MISRPALLRQIIWLWLFCLLALRFVSLYDTVFIVDEPLFQLKLDEHIAQGTFPLSSFRGSSIPLPYGAGALWFYAIPRLFSWSPYGLIFFHILAVTLGAFLFLKTIHKKFGEEPARWSGLLMASSPLLFFFSRHPWDNTLLFSVAAVLLWCLVQLEEDGMEYRYHAVMGLAVGYALNIHLMFGPVALALGLTLIFRAWKMHGPSAKSFWLPLLLFGGCALLVLIPYLWEAFRIMQLEHPLEHTKYTKRWGDGRNLWWLLQRSVIFSSIWGSRIYLENLHPYFLAFVGQPFAFLFRNDLFGWFAKIAAIAVAVSYPVQFLRGRAKFDSLRLFASLSLASMILVLHYLNIPTAPHYFHSVWWLVFLGVAVSLTKLNGIGKKFFVTTIVLTALVNTAFILSSLAFFHINKGGRNFQFSVSVGEQLRAIREICVEANARIPKEARVNLEKVWVLGPSFTYIAAHMPECRGVTFSAHRELTNPNFVLTHPGDSDTKADIVINWISP